MYSVSRSLSMMGFLHHPFRTVSGGGLAGLVFLVARSADAPKLQEQFFREWSDIDDLTGAYLGVITPAPHREMHISPGFTDPWPHGFTEEHVSVEDMQCLTDRGRLWHASKVSPWAVRMAPPLPAGWVRRVREPVAVAAPVRPGSVEAHQMALTLTVYDMQEFFGIPEQLVPCVVVASLEEQEVFIVALDDTHNVYQLLKKIKAGIEPLLPRIRKKEEELIAAQDARRRLQDPMIKSRRIVDILAKLDGNHSSEPRESGLAAARDVVQLRIGRVKAELNQLGRELRLGAAVVAAAEELGMRHREADVLLTERRIVWPVSVLARSQASGPTIRLGRA